jgi:molybdate transport system substrate-binding protein
VGDAEIGSTFLSEIVPMKAVKAVGPLPAPIQNATAYAAGIMTASSNREAAGRFIEMLTAPEQREAWLSFGFEPAGRG